MQSAILSTSFLASQAMKLPACCPISRELCKQVGIRYIDTDTINLRAWIKPEDQSLLYVECAGEMRYQLNDTLNQSDAQH